MKNVSGIQKKIGIVGLGHAPRSNVNSVILKSILHTQKRVADASGGPGHHSVQTADTPRFGLNREKIILLKIE
jgi:hypothetical protein